MNARVFAFRPVGSKPEAGPSGVVLTGRSLVDLFQDIDELCNPHELEYFEIKEHFFVHTGIRKYRVSENSDGDEIGCSESLIEALPPECFGMGDEEEVRDSKKKWRSFSDLIGLRSFEQWAHDVDLYGLKAIGARPTADHAV